MENPTLASATLWLPYIESTKFWAEVGVVICLAIGVIADRIGAPLSKQVERARELQLANANTEAAKANERAAELKLALKKEIAAREPRQIKPEQRTKLVAALATIPKNEVTVSWKLFDEEAERFGKQLLGTLRDSGFDAKEVRGGFSFGSAGQWVAVRDLKKFQTGPSWVGDLQTALNQSLGIVFDGQQMDASFKDEFGEVAIIVGAKP